MAMAACYSNYDLSQGPPHHHHTRHQHQQQQQQQHQAQSHLIPMAVHQSSRLQQQQASASVPQKDYSIPLHVDCSVEYELPNQAKPPPGARVEPLLMIHPCYFRKMESQRRSPFVNNMPNSSRNSSSSNALQSSRKSSRGAGSQMTSSVNAAVPSLNGVGSDMVATSQQQQQQQHLLASQTHQQQQQQMHHSMSQHIQQQKMSSQMSQQAQYPVAHQPSAVNYMDAGSQCGLAMRHHTRNQNQNQSTIQMPSSSNKSPSNWDLLAAAGVTNCGARISSDNNNSSMSNSVIQQHNRNQNQNQSAIQMTSSTTSSSSNKGASGWGLLASMAAIANNTNTANTGSISRNNSNASVSASNNNNNNNHKGISSDNSMTNTNFGLPTPLNVNNTGHSMYSKPVGKRDAMLSGACSIYNTSATVAAASATNSNNHAAIMAAPMGDLRMCAGRWEPERSPMAAIPRDYQAGPDATPITSIHDDKSYMLNGKYRQFLRSQRLHPYLMASGTSLTHGAANATSNTHNSMSFPQLTSSAFQQMQQISCYNV